MAEAVVRHETTDVARIDLGGGALVPLEEALAIARTMKGAVTLPRHWQTEADLTAAVLTAMQWRVPLMAVLRGCHLIDGKVSPSADLMAGIAQGSGQIADWREEELHNPTGHRIIVTTRDGRTVEASFTQEDAQAAGLMGKDNWRKYTRDMCRARAVSRAAARACPAVLAGVYGTEELGGEPPAGSKHTSPAAEAVIEAEFDEAATMPEQPAGPSAEEDYNHICEACDAFLAENSPLSEDAIGTVAQVCETTRERHKGKGWRKEWSGDLRQRIAGLRAELDRRAALDQALADEDDDLANEGN